VKLFGYTLDAKKTLTWKDICLHENISLVKCIEVGVDVKKLYRMQPNIREWIKLNKISIEHINVVADTWKPHLFNDFHGNLGDMILYRETIKPEMLVQSKIKFSDLQDKYGLDFNSMLILNYTLDEWLKLGLKESFVSAHTDEQLQALFGKSVTRNELQEQIKRHAYSQ